MPVSCHLTSLNDPIQRKTIVAVGMCIPTTTTVLPLKWGKFKLAKQQDSSILLGIHDFL
jgi:hypothetical protein